MKPFFPRLWLLSVLRFPGLLVTALIAAGCTQIPVVELGQYRDAFGQVKEVSEQVLIDFSQTVKASEQFVGAQEPAPKTGPYPGDWKEVRRNGAGVAPDDTEVRRKALVVVDRYNDALTTLAEGKSVEQVQSSSAGLLKSASNLRVALGATAIPGLAQITGLVSILVEQLEKARLREEFVRAVRTGAPVVDKILDSAIADIGSHYKARTALATRERLRVTGRMRSLQRSLAGLVKGFNVPAGDLEALRKRVDTAFSVQKEEQAAALAAIAAGGSGAPEYSELARGQVRDELTELEGLAAAYTENLRQVATLTAMLDQYETLLIKTKLALGTLLTALEKPQDVSATADDLLAIAFAVRRNLEELRAVRP